MSIGILIVRLRWWLVGGWIVSALALGLLVGGIDPSANEVTNLLPEDAPYSRAVAAMRESFPRNSGLSEAVVVFERRGGKLTDDDFTAIRYVTQNIGKPSRIASESDLSGVHIRSPLSIFLRKSPLISDESQRGQAALIVVRIPANFITHRSDRIVDHIHEILRSGEFPEGLQTSVTGSSAFGHDYADAAERSHKQTLHVTIVAVVLILLLVYRAPAAALMPLTGISLAAFVAMKVLALAQGIGMHVGMAERIFVIVLLYGAGTDYSLFFMSRFREFLNEGLKGARAAARALDATFPAILASSGTDTAGLLMLCFAQYGAFRTTGPAVAVALLVALAAAVTLIPTAAAIAGRRLFWPGAFNHTGGGNLVGLGRRRIWPAVARLVTARPGMVFLIVLIALGAPAYSGMRLTWVYDTLTAVKPNKDETVGNAAVGLEAAKGHWPPGQIAPVQLLVRTAGGLNEGDWVQFVEKLTHQLDQVSGVTGVRSLTRPLGRKLSNLGTVLIARAGWGEIKAEYLSEDMSATRLAVVLDSPAFSLEAMETVSGLRAKLESDLNNPHHTAELHIAGATAEMIDIRSVTQADFHRVAALSLSVIFVILVVLLRDVILSGFMAASTVLGYFATLGISQWVFTGLRGEAGLDWKVEVFLFVVMVAVGVDYSIFLVSRLAQEGKRLSVKLATARAIIHTGPVISSCGVIMAATLGSLMAGDLQLLKQLGFALSLGMLIDTFVVRPLLLPSFITLSKRTGRGMNLGH